MTCLKCGRTVPEGIVLCQECRAPKKTATMAGSALTDEERLRQQVKHLHIRAKRRIRWVLILAALCILTSAVVVGAGYLLRRQRSQIEEQDTRIAAIESANSALSSELEEANALNDTLSKRLSEAEKTIKNYYSRTSISPEALNWPPSA